MEFSIYQGNIIFMCTMKKSLHRLQWRKFYFIVCYYFFPISEKLEKNMLEMVKQKEENDKKLLSVEILIGILSMIILLGFTFAASFFQMEDWLRIVLIVGGFIPCLVGIGFAIRIEQMAGYYECKKCHHRYVPKYNSVFVAMHLGRTRFMKCPECHKRSWQKKFLTKE